jgi:hypothetical protein
MSRWVRDQLAARSRAQVVGVQSRACHLGLDADALVILSAPGVPLSPNGVAVDVAPTVTMTEAGFRAGQTVTLSSHGPGEAGADWRVVLDGAAIWEPRPVLRRVALGLIEDRLRQIRLAVRAHGASESLLPLLWPAAAAPGTLPAALIRLASVPARLLGEAAIRGDAESVAGAAAGLAGLGPGLTPSGDDLLAGFAAAWTLIGESLGLDGAGGREVASALVSGARAGASAVGRAWLGHAVRGELAEPLRRFADALFAVDARDLEPALRAVLGVGASSGTDWAVGFFLGADAALGAVRRAPS